MTPGPRRAPRSLGFLGFALAPLLTAACGPSYLDPEAPGAATEGIALQGEYAAATGAPAAQIVALGDGRFELVFHRSGLPGTPGHRARDGQQRVAVIGERTSSGARFSATSIDASLADGRLHGSDDNGHPFELERVERTSPTVGAPPPPGARVLLDESTNAFDGTRDANGWLAAGASSYDRFGDFQLHLEFRTPFMPRSRGQLRGNSGVYLQGRYEVQVLDSFGLTGAWNECGGLYKIAPPAVNMALPPLAWQTYDIEFRAARFDDQGRKIEPARVTLDHNGHRIHDAVALPGPTGRGAPESAEPGPLHLQDHWDPVVYRNIWLVER